MADPTRSLSLAGATNFRDLGGYAGHDGRLVRWRRIFRSDHLGALTAEDRDALVALGLTRVCDFRGNDERLLHPCALPGVQVHSLAVEPSVVQGMQDLLAAGRTLSAADTVRLMEDTYRNFVHRNGDRFGRLFAHLLESDAPLVFHCTAGKDRTGFAAALILLALGVPRDVVMQDYLLTNDLFRMPDTRASVHSQEVLQVLWRVQQVFLDAALQTVDKEYGGLHAYLAKALDVGPRERQRLAQMYLQPVA